MTGTSLNSMAPTPARSRKPAALAALEIALDPEGFFGRNAASLGDPYRIALPGIGAVLVSETPAAAAELFNAPPDTFTPLDVNPLEPLLGEHSLLLLHGARHQRERRLMTPAFGGERMRTYGEIMCEAARREAVGWRPGETVELVGAMRNITLGVILAAVLGVAEDPEMPAVRQAVAEMLGAYVPPLLVLPVLRRSLLGLGVGPWSRFVRARSRVCELFRALIESRRRESVERMAARSDILSLLMQARYDDGSVLSDQELIDELRTLLVAGHDTTATALVWAMHYSHSDVGLLERLLAELDPAPDPADLEKAPLLGAICNEALRLHPVVPILPRKVVRPFVFCGQQLGHGDRIALCLSRLHRRPELYAQPGRFDPDRFLERRYGPHEFAPFGGGVRRCIGAAFGTYQMRMVLGTLVCTAALQPLPPNRSRPATRRLGGITMGPGGPMRLHCLGPRQPEAR